LTSDCKISGNLYAQKRKEVKLKQTTAINRSTSELLVHFSTRCESNTWPVELRWCA